jgi:hypothetical protein
MGEGEVCTGFWIGKLEEKRPIGRPRLKWEDNIKMDLQERGCVGKDELIWFRIKTGGGHL